MSSRSPVAQGVLIALAVIAILLLLLFLWQLSYVVVLVLIAAVIAAGIDPPVERLHQLTIPGTETDVPRGVAILIVVIGAILIFLGIVVYIGSVLWAEGSALVQEIPQLTGALQEWIQDLREGYPQIPPLEDVVPQAQDRIGDIAQYALATTGAVFGMLGGLITFITVVVLTVYLTLSKRGILNGILAVTPPESEERVRETCIQAAGRMGGWLRGQLLLAAIITTVVSLTMLLFGMPFPLMIGLIGGIAELVPLLGPIVAALFAIPIAIATQPTWITIAVLIFFVVLSQFESNWLAPRIMASEVNLSPALVIVALLAGGTLLGLVGALLAVPVAAALKVIVQRHVLPAIQRAEE